MSLVAELRTLLGDNAVQDAKNIDPRHLHDWMVTAEPSVTPLAVVYPRSTEDVSAVLRACHAHGQAVVPQGGLTGLVGGAVPVRDCVVLSLERMRSIEEVDRANATMTVQAGVTLQEAQEAADAAGLLYPLDIGGRGSCCIGGNVSTNAGGNRVLRYGLTRDLVLGLEAVLPDGTVFSSMNKMLKNNAGYDLKHLFIGSEGTLGVVTRVVLRLHGKPSSVCTALCAIPSYGHVVEVLVQAKARLGGALSAFEVMWPDFYAFATTQVPGRPPLPANGAYHVLIETMGTDQAHDQEVLQGWIEACLEEGLVGDAVVAQSLREVQAIWAIRDASGEMKTKFSPHVDFDVSIPTGQIGAFVEHCTKCLKERWPEAETLFFGHAADSNLHIAVRIGAADLPSDDIMVLVYQTVRDWNGSISAEHGIGVLRRPYLAYSRTPEELDLMRKIKGLIDPKAILNPGKVL